MFSNSFNISSKQFSNLISIQPYRFVLYSNVKSEGGVRLIKYYFVRAGLFHMQMYS